MTRIPQSEDESLSITGRIVVRPGRTPNASSAAVGGADSVEHSVTRSWVVSEASVSSSASSGCSSGSICVHSGTRRSVSCRGIHRRPRSVSFSTTTCRFTRNASSSALDIPSRLLDRGVLAVAQLHVGPDGGRPGPVRAAAHLHRFGGHARPVGRVLDRGAAVERDLQQRGAAGHEHARGLRSRLLQRQVVALELHLAVQGPDGLVGQDDRSVADRGQPVDRTGAERPERRALRGAVHDVDPCHLAVVGGHRQDRAAAGDHGGATLPELDVGGVRRDPQRVQGVDRADPEVPVGVDHRDDARGHRHVRARHVDLGGQGDRRGVDDRDRAGLDQQHVTLVLQDVERRSPPPTARR